MNVNATFPDAFEMDSYLNAALLFGVAGLFDLGLFTWSWMYLPFVYVTWLVQAVGWVYLLAGSAESRRALALFLASALAGLASVVLVLAFFTREWDISSWSWAWLLLPILTIHPFVFGPAVALQGVLFAYAGWTARRGATRPGRGMVLLGVAILEVIDVMAMATTSLGTPLTFPWVALLSLGYLAVAFGFRSEKRLSASEVRPASVT